jgi:uncharacterized protein YjbI with pentapeptide repeats
MADTPRKVQNSIKAPQLPKMLPMAVADEDMLVDGETYTQLEFQQRDLVERVAYRLHFTEVIFTQVNATATHLDRVRMEDVRLVGCNLANAAWSHLACVRAEFSGCRMTGFMTEEALFHDTRFKDCKGDLAQFYKSKLRGVRFEQCPLVGADFRAADVTGVVFAQCDLTNVDFTDAIMRGADLRGCLIEGMRVGPRELQGAIVDEVQALALVRAMGIIID